MKYIPDDLKELVYEGHIIPGYYVNKQGELWSTRRAHLNKHSDLSMENVCYSGPLVRRKGTPNGKYILYRVSKLHTHRQHDGQINSRHFGVHSHRAVMETFRPFEDNLPKELINEWDSLSDVVKKYIKQGMSVDHIDPDSTKDTFHHISNLQWLTRSDNTKKGDS